MNRQESAMVGFEIVAYAGDARSKLINALKAAENKDFDTADKLIAEANDLINQAHQSQTEMLQAEARGEDIEMSFIMIHGQDHLMTTMLLRDVMKSMIALFKRG